MEKTIVPGTEKPAEDLFMELLPPDDRRIRVCYVCTGNTCRSPMAEAVTKHLCSGHAEALSCGLYPDTGAPISPFAAEALRKAGIPSTTANNYENHTAREASEELLASCDRIYGMTGRHAMLLMTEFPSVASKIYTMPREIEDPWNGSQEDYDRCLGLVTDCVKELFSVE